LEPVVPELAGLTERLGAFFAADDFLALALFAALLFVDFLLTILRLPQLNHRPGGPGNRLPGDFLCLIENA
jgi:hypothetical protein